jgi:hypothetical protein
MKTKFKNDPTDEYEIEVFQSEDLSECLDYYKDTKDILPLENSIDVMEEKIEKTINNLTHVILGCRMAGFDATANVLCDIRNSLQR